MSYNEKSVSASGTIMLLLVFVNALVLKAGFIQNENWYKALFITIPLLIVALYNVRRQKRNNYLKSTRSIKRSKFSNRLKYVRTNKPVEIES